MQKIKIFISVGTHTQQFDRLLAEADRIAEKREEIAFFAQIGNSKYVPKNFKSAKFLEEKDYAKNFLENDIIISHGGAGTIINALTYCKPLIVAPRLKKYGEHTDDHQLDIAKALEEKGKCIAVLDIKDLGKAIDKSLNKKASMASEKEGMIKRIKEFISKEELK
ncbi:MAG: PssE/Cps14G family polysaccharide biosynthesis glycosyltransferase [archaeon]